VLSGLVVFFARAIGSDARQSADTSAAQPEIDFSVYDDVETIGHWSSLRGSDGVFWSPSMYKIYDRDPETFVPRKSTVMSCYAPENRKPLQDKVDEAVRTGAGFEAESEIICQNGDRRYILVVGSGRHTAAGEPGGLVGYAKDITERKLEELALCRDREQLDYAIEAANAAIWDWDMENDVLKTSPRFAEILGYDPETWKPTMALHDRLCHPEDLPRVRAVFKEHVLGQGNYDVEYRMKGGSDQYIWVHSRGTALRNSDNWVTRAIGTVTDITERRHDQETLRRNEETLELAIEAAQAGYFDRRWDDEEIYWSPRLREIFGITDPSFKPDMKSFNDLVHPDDRSKLAQDVTAYQTSEVTLDAECRVRRTDGVYIWIQIRGMVQRDDAGHPIRAVGFVIDISERKRLESELAARSQLYRDVAAAAGEYIWEFDRRGIFTFVSAPVEDVLGHPAQEVIGRSPMEYMTKEKARYFRRKLLSLMRTQEGFKGFEVPGFRADGSVVWQRLNGTPIIGDDGAVVGFRGVSHDITAQKEAQEAVERSERKFRDLIEGSIQGLVIHRRFKPLFVNDAYAKMAGYKTGEELVAEVDSLLDLLPADFVQRADEFWKLCMSGEIDGQVIRGRIVGREGRAVWTDAIGRVVDWDGEPAFQITVIDVTDQHDGEQALKDSEERFRVVAENASDMITIREADGNLVYVSPSSLAITGYRPEEMIGQVTNSMVYEDDVEALVKIRKDREAGKEVGDVPFLWRLRRKDERLIWLETSTSELPIREGESGPRVLSMSRDVTDRVERERELEAARDRLTRQAEELRELAGRLDRERKRAEQANLAKSQFLAMMSHELRTPMTGVLGMVDLIRGTKVEPEQMEMLTTLHRSATALLDLLNDILDFSKIEAGELELEQVDFRLSAILDDVSGLFEPMLSAKGLVLHFERPKHGSDVLRGDPTRIRQVLINLIGNGAKFTTKGGVTVTVSQSQNLNGDMSLRFDVADTGIGIAAEDQTRLFQAFVQAESHTTRKFGGTGLGLAICRQLVEAMGGTIWVESEPGQGSVFSFTVSVEPGDPDRVVDPARVVDPGRALITQPLKFLVAEDNTTTQMLVRSMLERDGHSIDVAENGAVAVEYATSNAYDIVLMDMQMPVMDGPEAIRQIRASSTVMATRPIIALTADAIKSHRQGYLDAGANVVVTKPVNWAVLFTEVSRLTGAELEFIEVDEEMVQPSRASASNTVAGNGGNEAPSAFEQYDLLDPTMIETLLEALDEEILNPMLSTFKENMGKYVTELEALVAESDLEKSKRTAHALKGLAAQFGATRVSTMAKMIEESATDVEEVRPLLPMLRQSVDAAIKTLDQRD